MLIKTSNFHYRLQNSDKCQCYERAAQVEVHVGECLWLCVDSAFINHLVNPDLIHILNKVYIAFNALLIYSTLSTCLV